MCQTFMRLLLFPHSAGQRTRLRDLRGLRPHQLTAAAVRREASLGVSSLTHPIWPLRLGGPAVSPSSPWAHTYLSCPLPVSGPFSCSDDGGWGCTPGGSGQGNHLESGTGQASALLWLGIGGGKGVEQASGSTPSITGRCELQAHLSSCSEVLVWSRLSHSLWGWDREALPWEVKPWAREAGGGFHGQGIPLKGRGCSASQPGSRLYLGDREVQMQEGTLGRMEGSEELGAGVLARWEG